MDYVCKHVCYYSLMAQTINNKYKLRRTNHRKEKALVNISFFWLAWLAPKVEYNFSDEPSSLAHFGGLHFQKGVSYFNFLFLVMICWLSYISGRVWNNPRLITRVCNICIAYNPPLPTRYDSPLYAEPDAQARKHLFSQRKTWCSASLM